MVFLLFLLPTLFPLNPCWYLAWCDPDYTIYSHTYHHYIHSHENFLLVNLNTKWSLPSWLYQLYPWKYYSFFYFMEFLSVIILGPAFGNMKPLMLISKSMYHLLVLFWKRVFSHSLVFLEVHFSRNKAHGCCQQKPVAILGLFSPRVGRKKKNTCVFCICPNSQPVLDLLAILQMSCCMSFWWVKHDVNLSYLPLRKR